MTASPRWTRSALVQQVLALLERPQRLETLAERLSVTDARILFYLEQLDDLGWVSPDHDHWHRTNNAPAPRQAGPSDAAAATPFTILPLPSIFDYQQAFADADVFGDSIIQTGGEHAGRVSRQRVEEFTERLVSLVAEYFGPDAIDPTATPKYGFRWVLTPVDLHPLSDPPAGVDGRSVAQERH